jgi:hypothetical protein
MGFVDTYRRTLEAAERGALTKLAWPLQRLETQRRIVGAVAFELDAKSEPIWAGVTCWDSQWLALSRASGEASEVCQLRAGTAAGDSASTQKFVMSELLRVHGVD